MAFMYGYGSPSIDYRYVQAEPSAAPVIIADLEDKIRRIRQASGMATPNKDLKIGNKLYDDDSSKDFRIKVDAGEFRVHKCVLTVGSPHLATLIGRAEVESGVLMIADISEKTMEEFIRFLYKNEISEESQMDAEILGELIKFGHKCQMEHLIDYSIKMIGIHKDQFDKDVRRKLILMASLQSEKILDTILGEFKIEAFTPDYEPPKKQDRPSTSTAPHGNISGPSGPSSTSGFYGSNLGSNLGLNSNSNGSGSAAAAGFSFGSTNSSSTTDNPRRRKQ